MLSKRKIRPNNKLFRRMIFGGADSFIDEHLAEVYVSPLKAASISFSGMFSILSGFLLALMIKVK